jgi:hypothetical protein
MLQRLTTTFLFAAFRIVMMHRFPRLTRLNDIKWFSAVLNGLHHKV